MSDPHDDATQDDLTSYRSSRGKRLAPPRAVRKLRICDIKMDGGTQSRKSINPQTVRRYADVMEEQREALKNPPGSDIRGGNTGQDNSPFKSQWSNFVFPPAIVYYDERTYWLSEGFHRLSAALLIGVLEFECEIRVGGCREALRNSLSSNAKHGEPLTHADKRYAVCKALDDAEWGRLPNTQIAALCACSEKTVRNIKKDLNYEAMGPNGPKSFDRGEPHHDSVIIGGPTVVTDGQVYESGRQFLEEMDDVIERLSEGQEPVESRGKTRWKAAATPGTNGTAGGTLGKLVGKPAAPAPKAKPKPPAMLTDKVGTPLPPSCRDAFVDPALGDLIEEISALEAGLTADAWRQRAEKLCTHYPFLLVTQFKEHAFAALEALQLARAALEAGVPHAVCPKCHGSGQGTRTGAVCGTCRGAGHVPETRYQEVCREA